MPTMFWLWLAAAVIFLIIEIGTPVLVFACFVVGSAGAAVTATFYPESYLLQGGVFAVISMILIPLTRPLARRVTRHASKQKVNVDAMVGQTGIVIRQIIPSEDAGQVRVEGQVWRALANDVIDEGTKVKVDKISGAKLYVSKIDENE